jgi:prevent-host-death family protein
MKRASIRDFHIHTSELVHEAADGTVILIERRGEPVAELRPISKGPKRERPPEMTELWRRLPSVARDSGRLLEENR